MAVMCAEGLTLMICRRKGSHPAKEGCTRQHLSDRRGYFFFKSNVESSVEREHAGGNTLLCLRTATTSNKRIFCHRMKKTVLITGATSGIGEACARKFAQGGYNVIITGRRVQRLADLKEELEADGVRVLAVAFDVQNRKAATAAVNSLPPDWQQIDVLINNAGLALGLEPEYEGSFEDWETMIDTNVKGLLTMTRLIAPRMVKRNSGHIINIGSVAGDAAYAGGNVYCATKAAVKTLSDGLRIDLAHTAVRVTTVKPGLVETHFSNVRFHGDDARAEKVYQGIRPLTGTDIADVAFYAASAPAHVQIAEVLVLATHQASGSVMYREP